MRILISNDDGIFSEGIYALAKHLSFIGEVIVVAPNTERSAVGHGITMHHPLRVDKIRFFDTTIEAYSVNGTPADCVKLAVEALLVEKRPDIVVSGINNGSNLGTDVIYSGTVSAAVEAAILDIPSIAISMADVNIKQYDDAAKFACTMVNKIFHYGPMKDTIVNINYPTCSKEKIRGTKITTLGIRKYTNAFEERKDPRGNIYYWISGKVKDLKQNKDSDILAVKDNYISITPIHFDLTHYNTIQEMKKWEM